VKWTLTRKTILARIIIFFRRELGIINIHAAAQTLSMIILTGFLSLVILIAKPANVRTIAAGIKNSFWKNLAIGALPFPVVYAASEGLWRLTHLRNWGLVIDRPAAGGGGVLGAAPASLAAGERLFELFNRPRPSNLGAFTAGYLLYVILTLAGSGIGNPYGGDILKISGPS